MAKKRFSKNKNLELSAKEEFAKAMTDRVLPWELQSVLQIRQDIRSWVNNQNLAQGEEPKTWPFQLLLIQVANDALLTSQIENRKQQLFTSKFSLKKPNGEVDEAQTNLLKKSPIYRTLTNAILDAELYWYSLIELYYDSEKRLQCEIIPRTNIIPQSGTFYDNYNEESGERKYRELPEFGKWILEFKGQHLGLLNKVVPHVLMKKFAQSCWSELCEIYGIPPRVMKTNTRDASMLKRAQTMMKNMGAAAWFIIDNNENFEWANSVNTKGEVYQELIGLCNNEISMAITGAIMGQDTKNGSRSKDESAQTILWQLVQSDMEKVEQEWNFTIIPALQKIGYLKGELTFEFEEAEDLEQLFKFTQGFLPHKDIPDDWIEEKFGVKVTTKDPADPPTPPDPKDKNSKDKKDQEDLKADYFFA